MFIALLFIHTFMSSNNAFALDETAISRLQTKVRACVTLPYVKEQGRRVYQKLVSHCPELKVVKPTSDQPQKRDHHFAKLILDGRVYQIWMTPAARSDGDLYDLAIRDSASGQVERFRDVLAFGDIWLGVLEGQIEGLKTVRQ
jgi:hypothetical protein